MSLNFDQAIPFSYDIRKNDLQYVHVSASSASALNTTSTLDFQLEQASYPLNICEAYFKYSIEIIDSDRGTVVLEHNWFPNMFSSMSLKLGMTEIEMIQNPGPISELLNFVMLSKGYAEGAGEVMGWIPDDNLNAGAARRRVIYEKGLYTGQYPLKTLFGFLQNYNRVIYQIPFAMSVTRSQNFANVFYKKDAAVDIKTKLIFKELILVVPTYTLNVAAELKMITRINTGRPINVFFLTRICSNVAIPPSGAYTWKIATLQYKPHYIIVGFKHMNDAYKTNNSLFISGRDARDAVPAAVGGVAAVAARVALEIKSLRVVMNSSNYPKNPMVMSIKNNDFADPYIAYINMCALFGVDPQLSLTSFSKFYAVYCFDVSAQDEYLMNTGATISLEIVKDPGFDLMAYSVILAEKRINIELPSGKMSMVH